MDYGVKFVGSVSAEQCLDGNAWSVEILQRDCEDEPIAIELAAEAPNVSWGQFGGDQFAPILPSSAEVKILDTTNAVVDAVKGGDEEEFRIEIKKNGDPYWIGKLVADEVERSRDKRPRAQTLNAIDGLGALDDVSYTATGRVRVIKAIADILAGTNLGLNISAACNWFTPEILSNEDPLDKIKLDCEAFVNLDDTFESFYEVLTQILTRFGLQLYQKDGAWKIVQVELLASGAAYTYYTYDSAGTQTGSGTFDPTITVTEDDGYRFRKSEGTGQFLRPYKETTVEFRPAVYDDEQIITNGGFEDDLVIIRGWTKSDVSVPFGLMQGMAAHEGDHCAYLGHIGAGGGLPTEWAYLSDVVNIPIGDTSLVFKSTAKIHHPTIPPDSRPRHLWIEIQVGDYYFDGGSWFLIAGSSLADRLIEWTGTIAGGEWGVTTSWVEFAVNLYAIDKSWVGSRALKIFLYQCVDQFSLGDIQSCIWDDLKLEGIPAPPPTGFGKRTIAQDSVTESTGEREIQELPIGDSYVRVNVNALTVGDTIPTANWKRGPYTAPDSPTGVSIDKMLASSWLRMQKVSTLESNTEEYIRKKDGVGVHIEVDNLLVIDTTRYMPTEFTRQLIKGTASGEFVEVREDDDDIAFTEEAIVEET